METTLLRRRAAAKLADAVGLAVHRRGAAAGHRRSRWPRTGRAGWPVRRRARRDLLDRHRAGRAACSAAYVVGSDIDPVRLAMARHNVGGRRRCAAPTRCARSPATPSCSPTRPAAAAGGAASTRGTTRPPLDALLDVYRDRDLVVKCAPGIDFDAVRRLGFDGEIEVTSLAGAVREACLWSAGLAEPGVHPAGHACWTAASRSPTPSPTTAPWRPPGRWIVDPDGAVVRAGLVRHYAARHGLWQLDPDIAYLSGDRLPAGVRGIRGARANSPSARSGCARRCRHAMPARVEILVRGVDVDPDALRRAAAAARVAARLAW